MFKAVLSTTVLPLDGTYQVKTFILTEARCWSCQGEGNWYPSASEVIPCPRCNGTGSFNLSGVPHYIGHPDTKAIVEKFGAVQAPTKLFTGLEVGEIAICFPIQQGKSNRATDGFSSPHQDVSLLDLQVRIITRLE